MRHFIAECISIKPQSSNWLWRLIIHPKAMQNPPPKKHYKIKFFPDKLILSVNPMQTDIAFLSSKKTQLHHFVCLRTQEPILSSSSWYHFVATFGPLLDQSAEMHSEPLSQLSHSCLYIASSSSEPLALPDKIFKICHD